MANDLFISNYRHRKTELDFQVDPPEREESQSPEEEMSYREMNQTYQTALNHMPDIQREVFLLSRMEELKYREIAERLEISVKAVEKRMKNALQFLREAMEIA